jgi:phosphatidylserine/phosphatidylglycerophosphate/cardiolipin synthase-like enzyme
MKFGRRSTRSQTKLILTLLAFVAFFIYANFSAALNEHTADVTVLQDDRLLPVLVRDIEKANNSIYIAMYMFKSYKDTLDGAGLIKSSLKNAAKRGVDVYIALEMSDDNSFLEKENKELGKELQKSGVKVVFDSDKIRMHSKCAVIDGHITYIGSHNYTNSALKYNREITVRIVSGETAEDVTEHILSVK